MTECVLSTDAQLFATTDADLLGVERCLEPTSRCFGPHRVLFSQIFYTSPLSFALVNLKPIVPGSSELSTTTSVTTESLHVCHLFSLDCLY